MGLTAATPASVNRTLSTKVAAMVVSMALCSTFRFRAPK